MTPGDGPVGDVLLQRAGKDVAEGDAAVATEVVGVEPAVVVQARPRGGAQGFVNAEGEVLGGHTSEVTCQYVRTPHWAYKSPEERMHLRVLLPSPLHSHKGVAA